MMIQSKVTFRVAVSGKGLLKRNGVSLKVTYEMKL